ncbi:uncharacterized protein KY384_006441 [Bacidia gigantensis]|uniref:uncharacterized protein n=1 Tax=Bacidia gigantensis TaxID=2732470 RepID=UPI001D0547D8|nr:uncharacterized protein KY384_006441 [Bacidia gigantensis]KAG8528754.1 hypothetical protein KY384_006441 [Bacidia gigantensis]
MLVSLTVGKVDAGVAVLLTEDKRLIEFPSILLPSSITSGSIVDITVSRNPSLESDNTASFQNLQASILDTYGLRSPSPPVLRLRNATQTSIVLEWDSLSLETATLRSLSLFRNGAKAGLIPRYSRDGEEVLATKVSGLAIDTEYTFHLVMRTSAGTYTSSRLTVCTQKMTDLTGITVTPGPLPPPLRSSLSGAVERIGAKLVDGVRIDTTHFVCTEGRGREWERAVEMNIPVVRPEWIEGCEREGRIVGVRAYYLGADPKLRQVGQGVAMQQQPPTPQPQQRDSPRQQPLARESQQSLPIREQTERPRSPITPFPGAQQQQSGERDADDASGLSEGEEPPPQPPAKDQPRAGEGARERSVSSESSEVEDGHAGDDEDQASEAVSPRDEGAGSIVKPPLSSNKVVGQSQPNFSDVQL